MAKIRSIVDGFTIFAGHLPKGFDELPAGAGHDVIFGPHVDSLETPLNDDELSRLKALGWRVDDIGSWELGV